MEEKLKSLLSGKKIHFKKKVILQLLDKSGIILSGVSQT